MPTRRALLAASPDDSNSTLPGARQDVYNYEEFLLSIEGGAWEQNEIIKLFNPAKAEFLRSVASLSFADYVFIAFSGHGEHHVGKQLYETSLHLTATESCYVYEINPNNKRHFVAIDTCRAVVSVKQVLDERVVAMANAARPQITRQQARALFDETFASAEEGRVVAYSCKVDQAAGETPSGGFFSKSLVDESAKWAMAARSMAVLSVRESFDLAQSKTYKLNAPQWPELHAGRRLHHFPFAISVKAQHLYG